MLGRRRFGRHGQEGAPVVAVWGMRFRGFSPTGPRATSVSAPRRGDVRARTAHAARTHRHGNAPFTGPLPAAHSFSGIRFSGAAHRSSTCVVSCSDTHRRARPAERHHPRP
ncbi:predicted protein [Streptomyces viridosporus ATCC 14672]|uniref:Predicted protein n=1 Tax=Streptomyces viridosporus (strain ATCC 14672 / DSM 40746 / JCM 4963 / KCTC 9882 / NRRL B-12104 / FH 1290) TaxID=566461 RepID=D5ZQ42_STRV1|nr:predicted protein [Streptomyces viridosporus ATCC 14672]